MRWARARAQRKSWCRASARRRFSRRSSTRRLRITSSRTICTTARCCIPGTVVFPAVLAAAQASGASGREFIAASVAGYECGVRVGEFLGRSHYKVFHTTGTAGKLAAAAGVARLLKLDADEHAALPGFGRHDGGGTVGISARRGGLETTAHRESRGRRTDGRIHRTRRLHRRAPDLRRQAGHGGGHVVGRRRALPDRPAWHALGHRGNVVQVSRVVPAHASVGRCAARADATAQAESRRRSRASPRTCTRARSTCWGRSPIRAPSTSRNSRWVSCSR